MSAGGIAWQVSREEYERMFPSLTDGETGTYAGRRWVAIGGVPILLDVAPEPDPTGREPIDYSAITRDVS